MNFLFQQYFIPLLLTIIIEFVIFWLIIKNKPTKLFFYSIIINLFTQPFGTYLYQNTLISFYLVELLIIIIESVLISLLFEIKYKKAILISVLANITTALISFLF